MHVLITGHKGYIGSALRFAFNDTEHSWQGIDITDGDVSNDARYWRPRFEQVPDVIVHLAGVVGEDACRKDPLHARYNNVASALHMAAVAEEFKAKFIFASTCSNYGKSDIIVNESSNLMPLGLYAEDKVFIERTLLARRHTTILRFGTAMGWTHEGMRWDLLINQIAMAAQNGNTIEFWNPGVWRPFTHVNDIARAIIAACEDDGLWGVFNVVGQNINRQDLAKAAVTVWPELEIEWSNNPIADRRDYRVDGTKFMRCTSWLPHHSIAATMSELREKLACAHK